VPVVVVPVVVVPVVVVPLENHAKPFKYTLCGLWWCGVGRALASAGVGAGPGLAGSEFVGCAVWPEYGDFAGGAVEYEPPSSFVDSDMVVPTQE
jgi:hypothetical protein